MLWTCFFGDVIKPLISMDFDGFRRISTDFDGCRWMQKKMVQTIFFGRCHHRDHDPTCFYPNACGCVLDSLLIHGYIHVSDGGALVRTRHVHRSHPLHTRVRHFWSGWSSPMAINRCCMATIHIVPDILVEHTGVAPAQVSTLKLTHDSQTVQTILWFVKQ